jgi:3-(3-hydroxy-phenyl)propionate hydroxylase
VTNSTHSDTDVAIIGFGPVGALLAGLLGRRGVRTTVVERDADVYPLPRAAHIDHQGLRMLQEFGALDELLPTMLVNPGIEFRTATGEVLMRLTGTQRSISDLPASMYFHQPGFDRALRAAVTAMPSVEVKLETEMIGLLQSLDDVVVTTRAADGSIGTVRAKFAVGCDGAWSPVRETVGIKLESLDFDERWIVIDVILREPVEGLPDRAVTLCDPARPATLIPIPGGRFRFELQLLPGDDDAEMMREESIERLIEQWVPAGGATVERSAIYSFHGLVAEPWRSGRTLVAGDAAHQMPPFLGQGMCSGLRDASNLAWKLDQVITRGAPLTLLDTYEIERRPHVRHIVAAAVEYGRITCLIDPEAAAERDRQWLTDGRSPSERLPFSLPALEPGPLILEGGGELFLQTTEGDVRLDDAVGSRFLVVAADEEALGSASARGWWEGAVGALVTTTDQLPGGANIDRWLKRRRGEVAVVRPDRYVMGVGRDLDGITASIPKLFLAAETDPAVV